MTVAWDCAVCRAENEPDETHCQWCKNAAGDWICGCGRRNRKADAECTDCGSPKGDA